MTDTNRRAFLGGLVLATGGLAASQSLAVGNDGHALGYDHQRQTICRWSPAAREIP
jgi:hypothetical protein